MNRRTVLHAAAWAVPTMVVATAAPAIAASVAKDVLVFTNVTATVGEDPHAIYVNTKVQTTEGAPVPGLVVTITLDDQQYVIEHALAPWGATDLIKHVFRDVEPGRIAVRFHAVAPGCTPISDIVELETPGWWA